MDSPQPAEKGKTRKTNPAFRVYATPEERAQIIATAKACNLSASEFLRTLGLGYVPPTWLDADEIRKLRVALAKQVNLGRLLKLWLTNKNKYEAKTEWTMRKLSEELTVSQKEIREIVAEVLADVRRKKGISQ